MRRVVGKVCRPLLASAQDSIRMRVEFRDLSPEMNATRTYLSFQIANRAPGPRWLAGGRPAR